MQPVSTDSPQALARVIAMVMVADTELDPREIGVLDKLAAFERLGIGRQAFLREARLYCAELGQRMGEREWLRLSDLALINEALDLVQAPALRLVVARVVAGVITADGRVRRIERLVYEHMLARWQLTRRDVTRAVLEERREMAGAV